jgi:hypothetical protein
LLSGRFPLVNRFYSTMVELAYKKHQATLPDEKLHDPSEIDRLRAKLVQMSSQIPA